MERGYGVAVFSGSLFAVKVETTVVVRSFVSIGFVGVDGVWGALLVQAEKRKNKKQWRL